MQTKNVPNVLFLILSRKEAGERALKRGWWKRTCNGRIVCRHHRTKPLIPLSDLAGILTKRPERVRFATTSSIFLTDLTGLVGSDLSFVELDTVFELEFLVSEARTLVFAFGFGADCVFSVFGGFPAGFRCTRFLLRSCMNEMDYSEQ